MTIRLLAAYDIYPCGAIVTLTPANEAGMIAGGLAEANLEGGVLYTGTKGVMEPEDEPLVPTEG